MAGIFERMATIAKANINELLDRFEDPEKIVDQTIADAKVEYAKVKKESLSVLANESVAKKELERLNSEADKWHGIAASALKAGNEDDARKALEKENDYRTRATKQQEIYGSAKAASDKLRAKLREMEEEIKEMENKASQIKAMAVTAKATKAAAQMTDKAVDRSAFDAFARMEEKAGKQLAEAEALENLNRNTDAEEEKDLETKYASGGSVATDEALAKLKEELGM
ncbi:MAG: PspA/IM30 family protein [Lachnospiraceae bacterium]|nr:PspA/IM30 family protein [Lachnospiraceae bacterium]